MGNQAVERLLRRQAETVADHGGASKRKDYALAVEESLRAPGQPLDVATRNFFESRFGYDFGTVRIHTDKKAAEAARALQALAFTVGRHVVFGKGQYTQGDRQVRRLLSHELAHVVQQKAQPAGLTANIAVARRGNLWEQEADAVVSEIDRGRNASIISPNTLGAQVQCLRSPPETPCSGFLGRTLGWLTLDGFGTGSHELSEEHRRQLHGLAESIRGLRVVYPNSIVTVRGHTDSRDDAEYNLILGQRRADTVREALVALGISEEVILTSSAGENEPQLAESGDVPENRRVEIRVRPGPISRMLPSLTLSSPEEGPLELRALPHLSTEEERLAHGTSSAVTTPLPTIPPLRSLQSMTRERVNEELLNPLMEGMGIPTQWRDRLQDAMWAGIDRAEEAIVRALMEEAGFDDMQQTAIWTALQALRAATPLREEPETPSIETMDPGEVNERLDSLLESCYVPERTRLRRVFRDCLSGELEEEALDRTMDEMEISDNCQGDIRRLYREVRYPARRY